jgi:AraC family transcriptional regulator
MQASGTDGRRIVLSHGEFFGGLRAQADAGGFALAHRRADTVEEVRTHTHETAHFILLLDGPYVSSAKGAPDVCTRPTLVYNPPGTTHRDRFHAVNGRFSGRFFSLSVDAERMDSIAAQVPLAEAAVCLADPHALALAGRLARECRAWDAASPLVAEGLALELMAQVARRASPLPAAAPPWLRRARELLRDRCAGPVSVAEVAGECGVHPVHLARMFRRFFACTPGEYLRRCRTERAAALLRDTRVGLSEVALRAGFADQSQMTRHFGRAHGVTPAAYRRLLRGSEV